MPLDITRRDFLNATLIGAGAALTRSAAPRELFAQQINKNPWDGYGGVGDYARSHGNTWKAVRIAHQIRDGHFDEIAPDKIIDTGEEYELVVVGGGMSGLGAAFEFKKAAATGQRCLVIDNHPIFGGESKRNEFIVNNQRLIGPQGANDFGGEQVPGTESYELYTALGLPAEYEYRDWSSRNKPLKFAYDHYNPMLWAAEKVSIGHFYDQGTHWVADFWKGGLDRAPYSDQVRQDFIRWKTTRERPFQGDGFERWLDSMSYQRYLEKVLKLSPEVTRYVNPVVASAIGLGADVISAYGAYQLGLPGVTAFDDPWEPDLKALQSYPGGNDGIARHALKLLIPQAISGDHSFEAILNGRVNFNALDDSENIVRIRLDATVVRLEHEGEPSQSEWVAVTYVKDDRLFLLRARGVVMASGGWANRRIVRDLPEQHREAYAAFHHAPMLVVNVALTNWRFLYELGYTACRWFSGFGFFCNIRNPMQVGEYRPPLDPKQPTILTFYVPFSYPGLSLRDQLVRGRLELLRTTFSEYEEKILEQMERMFGPAGFDRAKDVAGIILNRWGHAYVCPQPGFYFGTEGRMAPPDVIRQRHGRVAFGHAELRGHQYWSGAMSEGRRAARQVLE